MANTLELARMATEFAGSAYGKHHILRLREIRANFLKQAMVKGISDAQRSELVVRAAVYDTEIEYFDIARSISSNPDIISRLKNKLKTKEFEDIL